MEESNGRVDIFIEKPKIFMDNKINDVIYLLNPSVLDRIELKPTSIEKEIFPQIASSKQLYAMVLPGFWMGIGQPKDYISGLRLYLDPLRKNASSNFGSFNDFFHGCIFFRSKLLDLCCGLSIVDLGGKIETPKGNLGELKPSSSPAAQTLLLVFNQEISLFCLLSIDLFPMVASLEKKQKMTKG